MYKNIKGGHSRLISFSYISIIDRQGLLNESPLQTRVNRYEEVIVAIRKHTKSTRNMGFE